MGYGIIPDNNGENKTAKSAQTQKRKIKLITAVCAAVGFVGIGVWLGLAGVFKNSESNAESTADSSDIKYYTPKNQTFVKVAYAAVSPYSFTPEITKLDDDIASNCNRMIFDENYIVTYSCDPEMELSNGAPIGHLVLYKINVETEKVQEIATDYLVCRYDQTELVKVGGHYYALFTVYSEEGKDLPTVILKIDFEKGIAEETDDWRANELFLSDSNQLVKDSNIFYNIYIDYYFTEEVMHADFFDVATGETRSFSYDFDVASAECYSTVSGETIYIYVNQSKQLDPYIAEFDDNGNLKTILTVPMFRNYGPTNSYLSEFKVYGDFVYMNFWKSSNYDISDGVSVVAEYDHTGYFFKKESDTQWRCTALDYEKQMLSLPVVNEKYLFMYNADRFWVYNIETEMFVAIDLSEYLDYDNYLLDIYANQNGDVLFTLCNKNSGETSMYTINAENIEAAFHVE